MTSQPGRTEAPLLGEPLPVELMNTIWAGRDGVHDALRDAAACVNWLASVPDLLPASGRATIVTANLKAHDVVSLRRLRDALRRLAAIASADDRVRAASAIGDRQTAIDVLNGACAAEPSWSQLSWPAGAMPTIARTSTGSPLEMAISAIAEAGAAFFAGPQREQLRACHAPGCVLYYVRDHPQRRWCSAGCGNRARVARHYQAHRAQTRT
jgi:predicted RNA-binding Zn ribbon-like protein